MKSAAGLVLLVIVAGVAFVWIRDLQHAGLPEPGPEEAPLQLTDSIARLTLVQRRSADVPGSDGRLRVEIGDITRKQVGLTLTHTGGRTVIPRTSVVQGQALPFSVGGRRYRLTVVELNNQLVGSDTATLEISEGRTERERIESLLQAVAVANVTFIRNGKEYEGEEASAHLRRKWEAVGDRIRTAEQFIEHLASRSSMSGRLYQIRLTDGTVVETRQWLRERLAEQPTD
ncbi:MAG: DUF5329 family protein [Planctomycetota bacterium]